MGRHEVVIERPIGEVFAVLTDVTLTGRWYPANVEEWWLTPPPHGVASVRRARVKLLGLATENDAEVIEFDPPRRAALRGLSRVAPFHVRLDFERAGEATRVTVHTDVHLRGMMRLLGPLFVGPYERGWRRGLARARAMMERGELRPRPAA